MIIVEHNVETNEIVERTMSAAEEKKLLDSQKAFIAEQVAKEAAKKTILDKLGITAEEINALGL